MITPFVGGGFGGKSANQQGIEAARLAVAAGKPVRVTWSREEEFFYDTFDPATVINIRAGLMRRSISCCGTTTSSVLAAAARACSTPCRTTAR